MANIRLTELTELLSVNNSNTVFYAADLSTDPNVSHYVRLGSISSLTDYTTANAAFIKANTAFSTGYNANLALSIAQTANTIAVGAVKRGGDAITGIVTAPTAAVDTNSQQLATTAFVINQNYLKIPTAYSAFANISSPTFTGYPRAPTLPNAVSNTSIATTQYVKNQGYLTASDISGLYQTSLGFTPVQQGGGTGQQNNKIRIGWGTTNLLLQVDNTNYANNWPINISGVTTNTNSNGHGTKTIQPISSGVPINSFGSNGDIVYQY